MAKKLTNEEFINRANQKHNGKYNYSKTIYKNKRTNVIITCPIHGDFEQNPEVHLRGSGCPKCGKSISSNKRLKSKETIIEEFKKAHGNKYNYSLVDYKGTDTKVKIICPIHGVFLQTPYEHKKGSGCPVCNNRNKTTEDFIKNKHNYSKEINNQNVEEIKKTLGDFPFNKYKDSILFSDYQNLCNGNYRDKAGTGNYIIKHFFNNIWSSKTGNKPSPLEAWYNNDLIEQVIKNRLIYSNPPYTKEKIKYGLYVSKIAPKVSVFNPNLAKRLIKTYLNEFDTILDPFSGFGGRLLGTCSIGKKYIGFDINEQMVKNGNDVISFFNLNATITKKDVFENFGEYDCLLTCPPYNLKETWGEEIKDLSCDEWIDICLKNFKCKKYLFVVDNTEKYKNNIVEEITNNSHLGTNTEKVILI